MTKILISLSAVALLGNLFFLNALRLDIKYLKDSNAIRSPDSLSKNTVVNFNVVEQQTAMIKKLDEMSRQLNKLNDTANSSKSIAVGNKLNKSNQQPEPETHSINASINQSESKQFPASIEETFAVGFVDKSGWESMEKDLKTMSKEENKLFWVAMFEKLENDEVVQIGD